MNCRIGDLSGEFSGTLFGHQTKMLSGNIEDARLRPVRDNPGEEPAPAMLIQRGNAR